MGFIRNQRSGDGLDGQVIGEAKSVPKTLRDYSSREVDDSVERGTGHHECDGEHTDTLQTYL
jgi:hypothetical protein